MRDANSPDVPVGPANPRRFAAPLLPRNGAGRRGKEAALLSPREVAELLAVNRATVYELIARGELRAVRVASALRIARADLAAYLE